MSYDLLFQKAINLHENGFLTEAEQIYRQILETAPHNPDVLNLLGLVAQAKGIHNQAVSLFYQAINYENNNPAFYFNLALSLDTWEKPYEAIDNYNKALSLDNNIKEAYNNIGNIYKNLNNISLAIENYQKAIAIDKNYAEAQANLAMSTGDIETLKQLSKKYPNDALSFYFLSQIYYTQSQYNQALEYIEQADIICPNYDNIKVQIGYILLAQNKTTEAKINFEKALAYNPNSISALINLGNIETNFGNFEFAEKHYKKALDLDVNELNAHINYANMLYLANRLPEALEECRQAVIINPNIPEVSNNLGIILKDLEEYEEALGLFFNALNKQPEREEFSINIAETLVLFHRQFPENAIKIAQNWLNQFSDNVFAQHTLASLQGENIADSKIYSEKLFDHFADNYELVLQRIGYSLPRSLRKLIMDAKGTIVDLGCGSGLVGEAFKTDFTQLIGVDISEKMLEKARSKGCYQELIKSDIGNYLKTKPKTDLIIAADVFGYIGDLAEIIKLCHPIKLAFSIEASLKSEDFTLTSSGRYQHNPQYIEKLLQTTGYNKIEQHQLVLRQENGKDVKGIIFIAS